MENIRHKKNPCKEKNIFPLKKSLENVLKNLFCITLFELEL